MARPGGRREQLLDAAIVVLGKQGMRAVTHRAVDAAAGVSAGSTSNYFRTWDALFDAIVARIVERERANWDTLTSRVRPSTPTELAQALAMFAQQATGPDGALTLARYAVLVEAARRPELRPQLSAGGARVNDWFAAWIRVIGSKDPDHDMHVVMNYWTGLVLHQLALPDPCFDPSAHLSALLVSLITTPSPARATRPAGVGHGTTTCLSVL